MRWKGADKWNLKSAQGVGTLALLKMSMQQKAELAQFYYNQFNLRVNTYTPAEIPFAFTQLVHNFDRMQKSEKLTPLQRAITIESPVVISNGRYRELNYPFSEMENPNASLNSYIRRMQAFFDAKTSTVSGWREVSKAQDISLFGSEKGTKYHYEKDENGKRHRVYEEIPKYTLTDDERRKVWQIINLAKDAGWLNRFGYDSGQAHKELAGLWMKGAFNDIDDILDDIDKSYNRILAIMKEKEEKRGMFADVTPGIEGNPTHRRDEGGDNIGESGQPDLLSQDDSLQ